MRILFNAWTPEAIEGLENGSKRLTKEEDERLAWGRCHYDNGSVVMPSLSIHKALLMGLKLDGRKHNRRSLATYALGGVIIDPAKIPFGKKKPDGIQEDVGGEPGKAVILRRPYLDAPWRLAFNLIVIDDIALSGESLKAGLIRAGFSNGLGSFRPQYGRFEVRNFEESKK